MSKLFSDSYYLSPSAVEQLSTHQFAGFIPKLFTLSDIAPYTALDDFDQTLRKAGRLLLDTGTTLELINEDGRLISQESDREVTFTSDFSDGEVAQNLKNLNPLRRLMAVGTGLWQRARLDFVDASQTVQCSLAMVFLTGAQDRALAVGILHEPQQPGEQFHRLRERIARLSDTTQKSASETEDDVRQPRTSWVDTLFPLENPYDSKPTIVFDQGASAGEAANAIIAALIPIAWANVPGIIADHDSEFLHDYRIQLRKIRSVLGQHKKVYKKSDVETAGTLLSDLMKLTGRLRDLDVQLQEKSRYYDLLPQSLHEGLDSLFDLLEQRRKTEHTRLARLLASDEYRKDAQNLHKLFIGSGSLALSRHAHKPARDHANQLLLKRFQKICKLAVRIDRDASDEELHSLRIQCKKLRYSLELLSSLYLSAPLDTQITTLKKLQDTLGNHNDYVIQRQNLIALLTEPPQQEGEPDIKMAQSIGALISILGSHQQKQRNRIFKSIKKFTSDASQASFGELIRSAPHVAPPDDGGHSGK